MKDDFALAVHHAGFIPTFLLVAAVAALLHASRRRIWYFALLSLPGTIAHEAAHLIVGLFLGAAPQRVSLWPRRAGRYWQLGSVTFGSLSLLNGAFVTLAPLLLLPLSLELFTDLLALWTGEHWAWWLAGGYVTAAVAAASLPSVGDLRLGARSILFYAVVATLGFAGYAALRAA